MSSYHGDALDVACEENLGHTNWGYASLEDLERIVAREKARIKEGKKPTSEGIGFGDDIECLVIFYNEPLEEEEEEYDDEI
jgi:hypothetical protein